MAKSKGFGHRTDANSDADLIAKVEIGSAENDHGTENGEEDHHCRPIGSGHPHNHWSVRGYEKCLHRCGTSKAEGSASQETRQWACW